MNTAARKIKAARYLKIVEWSASDKCFIGRCPGLFNGGIHGDDEATVYSELCAAAEEWISILENDGKPLPVATAGKTYSGKFAVRVAPALHQRAALKAMVRGESLNQFVARALAEA
jgi:predicted HicB family RNase H-like nuclease